MFLELKFPLSEIAPFNISNTIMWEEKYRQILNQILKKTRAILQEKTKKVQS